jgi:hypothetical protein
MVVDGPPGGWWWRMRSDRPPAAVRFRPVGDEAFDISLGYYRGPLEQVLAALDAADLEGAILEVHGTSDDLYDFVKA